MEIFTVVNLTSTLESVYTYKTVTILVALTLLTLITLCIGGVALITLIDLLKGKEAIWEDKLTLILFVIIFLSSSGYIGTIIYGYNKDIHEAQHKQEQEITSQNAHEVDDSTTYTNNEQQGTKSMYTLKTIIMILILGLPSLVSGVWFFFGTLSILFIGKDDQIVALNTLGFNIINFIIFIFYGSATYFYMTGLPTLYV